MKVDLRYGNEETVVNFPDTINLEVLSPNEVRADYHNEILYQAFENPIHSSSFDEFIADGEEILFLVNDQTRLTPTAAILDSMYDKIKNKKVRFLVSTGSHRKPTQTELRFIFGDHYDHFREEIFIHDSQKREDMIQVGVTQKGDEIWINKMGAEAHKIVVINSVEPHYFAGYTGGRKSFFPGIADYQTIEQNHQYALDQNARTFSLKGNPVHENMVEALQTIQNKEIFSIQVVLDRDHQVVAVFTGHLDDSFGCAVKKAREVFGVEIEELADIVVCEVLAPKDINLYQTQNSIENGKRALKEKGILIVVSSCWDGIGPSNFFDLLKNCKAPAEVQDKIVHGYKLGYHKAYKFAETALHGELWGVTQLPDTVMSRVFMKPFGSVQDAVDEAITRKGRDARVLVLSDSDITIPVVKQ